MHATWEQARLRPTWASSRVRRAVLVALACAALGAFVIADFPVHASVAYRRSALAGFLATVHHDLAPCSAGLHDAVLAYAKAAEGSPVVRAGVPSLFASQAIAVCGFADSGVVNLGQAAPPASVASPVVDRIARQADAWAYLDAFTLLQDLRRALSRPDSAVAYGALRADVHRLALRRKRVERLVIRAERGVGAPRRPLPLTSLGPLLPAGQLPRRGAT